MNPIHAGIADTPESSDYTSIQKPIGAMTNWDETNIVQQMLKAPLLLNVKDGSDSKSAQAAEINTLKWFNRTGQV